MVGTALRHSAPYRPNTPHRCRVLPHLAGTTQRLLVQGTNGGRWLNAQLLGQEPLASQKRVERAHALTQAYLGLHDQPASVFSLGRAPAYFFRVLQRQKDIAAIEKRLGSHHKRVVYLLGHGTAITRNAFVFGRAGQHLARKVLRELQKRSVPLILRAGSIAQAPA